MTLLILPPHLRAQLEQEARAARPRECCGLIEGVARGETLEATALHPAPNLAPGTDDFEIDPARHLAVQRAVRARGTAVIGCYHSHPDGKAQPSARDRAGAAQDDFLWLIAAVGARGARTAGFIFKAPDFQRVAIAAGPRQDRPLRPADASLDPAPRSGL